MKIRTETILRLRDHLLEPLPAGEQSPAAPALTADAVLRRIDPFAELMYVVIAADSVIEPLERQALLSALDILSDGAVPRAQLEALLEGFGNSDGRTAEGRIAEAAARIGADREDRETAFLLAAAVALADDDFQRHEQDVMEWVRGYLGISERRVEALLAETR